MFKIRLTNVFYCPKEIRQFGLAINEEKKPRIAMLFDVNNSFSKITIVCFF